AGPNAVDVIAEPAERPERDGLRVRRGERVAPIALAQLEDVMVVAGLGARPPAGMAHVDAGRRDRRVRVELERDVVAGGAQRLDDRVGEFREQRAAVLVVALAVDDYDAVLFRRDAPRPR